MESLKNNKNWYVVYTRAKCEKTVESTLSTFCPTYLPLQIVRRRWSDRYKNLRVPLIPSYVFVQNPQENKLRIFRTPNVVTILNTRGKLQPVTNHEIEIIRQIEASRMPFQFQAYDYRYWEGEKVVFTQGPLMGMEGFVDKLLNSRRVAIFIPSLNGCFTSEINEISPHQSSLLC